MTTERERNDAQRATGRGPLARDPKDAGFAPEQIATPASSPPLLGGKQVQAVVGPHAGSVLTMPEAEADQAITDKWAIEQTQPPLDANAPPAQTLDDAELQGATDAANAWAAAQFPHPEQQPLQVSTPPSRGDAPKPTDTPREQPRDARAAPAPGAPAPGYETRHPHNEESSKRK